MPLVAAQRLNEIWSMDFVADQLSSGRQLKCLTVTDDFSHESVLIAVEFVISGLHVTRLLNQAARYQISHILIQPRRPMQNGNGGSFSGKLRDECLNKHYFDSLKDARQSITQLRDDYNQIRPRNWLGRIPHAIFAAQEKQKIQRKDKRQDKLSFHISSRTRTSLLKGGTARGRAGQKR